MKGPRKFNMLIPNLANGSYLEFQANGNGDAGLARAWKEQKKDEVVCFVNNPPQWSEGGFIRS